jgi:hypothetical protein
MNVYCKQVADLLVGDYLRVVSHVPNEDQRPECFRRVEKIEYIETPAKEFFANRGFHVDTAKDLPPRAGAVIVWCHGVGAPLIFQAGDETVWADVPEERRELDEGNPWWGTLDDPLFPTSREPNEAEITMAELGDIRDRVEAERMWET